MGKKLSDYFTYRNADISGTFSGNLKKTSRIVKDKLTYSRNSIKNILEKIPPEVESSLGIYSLVASIPCWGYAVIFPSRAFIVPEDPLRSILNLYLELSIFLSLGLLAHSEYRNDKHRAKDDRFWK